MTSDSSHRFSRPAAEPSSPSELDESIAQTLRTATRADILNGVYASCPTVSRSHIREVFEMTLAEVSRSLTQGENVKLRAFGLFCVREKRERIGRNPRTGVAVPITPRRVLTFKPSPVLLDQLNVRDPEHNRGKDH